MKKDALGPGAALVAMLVLRRQRESLNIRVLGCFSVLSVLSFLSTAFAAGTVDGETIKRPNVLLMIADDMSWKDWGVYGNKFVKTPHIDMAAEEGVRFSNAYCTSPVCHPSRSALLTGQDIWRLRDAAVFGGTLHNTFDTYPTMLRDAGYEVAHRGKGWGPGYTEPGGWKVPPTGRLARLPQLLAAGAGGERPFCFWWGTTLGHRAFNYRPDDFCTFALLHSCTVHCCTGHSSWRRPGVLETERWLTVDDTETEVSQHERADNDNGAANRGTFEARPFRGKLDFV